MYYFCNTDRDEYNCKYTNMDNNAIKKQFRPQAERQVKLRLALEKIAELENLSATQEELDPAQCKMIRYNTTRTVFFVGAIASYLYFLGDGVLNYNGPENSVKKATTLAMICPGAGQLYNKSYWKVILWKNYSYKHR